MVTIKIPCEEIYDLPQLCERTVDNDRWAVIKAYVVEKDSKKYLVYREMGATEMQEEDSWSKTYNSDGYVEATEVELKEVKVKKWVAV